MPGCVLLPGVAISVVVVPAVLMLVPVAVVVAVMVPVVVYPLYVDDVRTTVVRAKCGGGECTR
jgi:hypothetical protein